MRQLDAQQEQAVKLEEVEIRIEGKVRNLPRRAAQRCCSEIAVRRRNHECRIREQTMM